LTPGLARRYLSYTDRTGEIAFAVLMVIIINGYVAISNLNTGFLYIVVVNLGACAGWGFIDGFIYAISSSIERNNLRNKLTLLKRIVREQNNSNNKAVMEKVESNLDDTFFSSFNKEGKEAVAKDIVTYVSEASLEDNKVITKEDALGWLSIILIYLTVGFLLALPFFVFSNKVLAWLISNLSGVVWLFWYGFQLGKSVGKYRIALGFSMSAIGLSFLIISYIVWVG